MFLKNQKEDHLEQLPSYLFFYETSINLLLKLDKENIGNEYYRLISLMIIDVKYEMKYYWTKLKISDQVETGCLDIKHLLV